MSRIKLLITLSVLSVFYFVFFPTKNVLALDCKGKGEITYSVNPANLEPNKNVILKASFKWGTLSNADADCFKENITLDFLVKSGGNIYSIAKIPLGIVANGQTKDDTHLLSYADVLPNWLSSNPVQLSAATTILNTYARAEDRYTLPDQDYLAVEISSPIFIGYLAASQINKTFACVAGDGKYACCSKSDCSDSPACAGKNIIQLDDSRKCGQAAPVLPTTHKACVNNACVDVSGTGSDGCTVSPNSCAARGSGGSGGGGTTVGTELPNPIGIEDFGDLVNLVGKWIFNISIPIAVAIIIYAGILMLTAGANPGNFKKGTAALKYAVIGLAIIFIGKGFVTLIQSILSLKNG